MLLSSSFILSVSACMILIQGAYCNEYEDYVVTDNDIVPAEEYDSTTDTTADDYNNDLPDDYDPEDEPTHSPTPRKRPRHRRVKIIKVPVLAHRRIVRPRPACSPIIINPSPTARKPRMHHHTLLSPITNFVYAFVKAFVVGPDCD